MTAVFKEEETPGRISFRRCVRERGPIGLTQTPQQSHPLSPLHEPLHWRAKRDPKAKMLFLQSLLRKGVSLRYVGLNENLKGLKEKEEPTKSLGAGSVPVSTDRRSQQILKDLQGYLADKKSPPRRTLQ